MAGQVKGRALIPCLDYCEDRSRRIPPRAKNCRECDTYQYGLNFGGTVPEVSRAMIAKLAVAMGGYKDCPTCKTPLPRSLFAHNKGRPDGLHGECKPCACRRDADRRAKKKEVASG